ncbi:MAG: LytTR family DNA-binding domain-containing protein [Roseovarius sp.]|nr:LytTR family DNA-binding domain-containing protein [Roseovarius sp.]
MSDSPMHFAKRELRQDITNRQVWIGLVAATAILGIVGPYDTNDTVRLFPRFAYWLTVVVVPYLSGRFVGSFTYKALEQFGAGRYACILGTALTTCVVILPEVLILNWLVLGVEPFPSDYLWMMIANISAISIVMSVALVMMKLNRHEISRKMQVPRIMSRLKKGTRGPLISMTVFDHYVEVTTTKGRELLLMRLSDAIAETDGIEGLQVHRSHWVAVNQVEKTCRNGERVFLHMRDGREIPVSRAKHVAIRSAGLWPTGNGAGK